jgi:RNA polymerase sigma factor (sigma-70 family)
MDSRRTVEAVFRIERARLIAGLARLMRDVGRAEELTQDALVAALAEWPRTGVPRNPGAWLMATAKRRGIDALRHDRMRALKHAEIAHGLEEASDAPTRQVEAAMDDEIGDELLGLMFVACHPVLSRDARTALTLRLIAGLSTAEIARAFLASEATIAQRIVRAKRTLGAAGLGFEVPRGPELAARLASVMEVVYLIFNEGYAATAGEDPIRPALAAEARRLGAILAGLVPDEPEVLGLVALMDLQASRFPARTGPRGEIVPLTKQNRARWDRLLIGRGLAALDRAATLGGPPGPYALQAAIAACHARARRPEDTDWGGIAAAYDLLRALLPTPVVALNRAIAHSMVRGPEAGLALLAEIEAAPALRGYAPLPAAKGDFLLRAGRRREARGEFERAAALTRNAGERAFLLGRAAACGRR